MGDLVETVAKAIYEAVYSPGEEDREGFVMPPFDEAKREEYGGYDRAVEAARAALAAIEASGTHVVVPVEPHNAMNLAGLKCAAEDDLDDEPGIFIDRIYAAMLAARPKVIE